jgi:hypothetical protein
LYVTAVPIQAPSEVMLRTTFTSVSVAPPAVLAAAPHFGAVGIFERRDQRTRAT